MGDQPAGTLAGLRKAALRTAKCVMLEASLWVVRSAGARQPTTIRRKRSAGGQPGARSSAYPTQQIADDYAGKRPSGRSTSDVRTQHLRCIVPQPIRELVRTKHCNTLRFSPLLTCCPKFPDHLGNPARNDGNQLAWAL